MTLPLAGNSIRGYTDRMRRFLLVLAITATAHAQLTLTPATVEPGSPELIQINAPQDAQLTGTWFNQPLSFFHRNNHWYALAGVDVETTPGPTTLTLTEHDPNGATHDLSRTVEIQPSHYRTASLTVAPRFTEPNPDDLKQIQYEVALKQHLFDQSAPQPLWQGRFTAPVTAPRTASFGTRRIFNGKLASIHKGMDFRAHTGTPVHASAAGRVILAQKLYFEGNIIIIDHGQGLFTLSMHLSRIDVHTGDTVKRGQLLGLTGATGRVTGPHLHWAIRWHNAYVDPAKFLALPLP